LRNLLVALSILGVILAALLPVVIWSVDADHLWVPQLILQVILYGTFAIIAAAAVWHFIIQPISEHVVPAFRRQKREWGYGLWVIGFLTCVILVGAETPNLNYNLMAAAIGASFIAGGWLINHWPMTKTQFVRNWQAPRVRR